GLESVSIRRIQCVGYGILGFLGARIRRIFLDGYGVLVIRTPLILSPIPITHSVALAKTLLTHPTVSTISPVLLQTTILIPTPPITIEAPPVTMIPDPLPLIIQREYVLKKDMQEIKGVNHTATLCPLLRFEIPLVINAYLGSSLGDALQKVLQKHTEELKQQHSQKIDYKEIIEESAQENVINKIDKSRSYLTHDKHRALSNALLNSMSLNDAIAHGQADLEKVLRKRDHDEEDPSAGPNQGKKTKRSRTKESQPVSYVFIKVMVIKYSPALYK
nr:hypothetical protein [Tanacetum cinerariifolium]